jgi:hypothetical protein
LVKTPHADTPALGKNNDFLYYGSDGRVPQACGQFHGPKNQVKCPHPLRFGEGTVLLSPLFYDPPAFCVLV